MCGENKDDFDLVQQLPGLLFSDPGGAHATESAEERSWLGNYLRGTLCGASPSFAVIRFGEIGKFKVDRKRLRHLMRLLNIHTADNRFGLLDQRNSRRVLRWTFSLLDQEESQFFDGGEQFFAGLFFKHKTQETTERTDISA
jgi:hypothetical protein